MKQFEYKEVPFDGLRQDLTQVMNEQGAEGWRFVVQSIRMPAPGSGVLSVRNGVPAPQVLNIFMREVDEGLSSDEDAS
jgi:hypothetical protein